MIECDDWAVSGIPRNMLSPERKVAGTIGPGRSDYRH